MVIFETRISISLVMFSRLCVLMYFFFQIIAGSCQIVVSSKIYVENTNETLMFCTVIEKGTGNVAYSNIDGVFTINVSSNESVLQFKLIGYNELELTASQVSKLSRVELEIHALNLKEVVVRPGANPAERIINRAIANRDVNNPEKSQSFNYDCYNKLFFDLVFDTTGLKTRSLSEEEYLEGKKEMDDQHLFLVETISTRKYLPPDHSEETIIATRVSGLENPDFAMLGSQLQSFSFYGDYVEILSSKYLSPLTKGSTDKYLFIIEDTTLIGADTVFTLSFRPRKGKNFLGMKGQLFIHTDGYALEHVIAEPNANDVGMKIKIQQQYKKVDGKVWFPDQWISEIVLPMAAMPESRLVGEGRCYVQNVRINPVLKARDFSPVILKMDQDAVSKSDSIWSKYRVTELDNKDLETYRFVDSLGKAENFDNKIQKWKSIIEGYWPIGKVSLDINRFIAVNSYEGFRLGAGLHTNDLFSKRVTIGGYGAYGFKDGGWKYGADGKVYIKRVRDVWMKVSIESDVRETGGNQFEEPRIGFSTRNIYPLFINRMDRYEKREIQLNGRWYRNASVMFFANQQYVKPYENIFFYSAPNSNESGEVVLQTSNYRLTETGASFRIAPGEKLIRLGEREIKLGGRFPVFFFKYTHGWNGDLGGDFAYDRYDAAIEKTFYIKNVGEFKTRIVGGLVVGDLPLSLYYNAKGSHDNWSINTPDAFETMRTNEFQNAQFVALQVRHNFKDLLFSRPRFKPHLQLVHSMMYGKAPEVNSTNVEIKSLEKGYFESGIQLDNLYSSGFTALGLGGFYRYGDYAFSKNSKNFTVKITTSLNF